MMEEVIVLSDEERIFMTAILGEEALEMIEVSGFDVDYQAYKDNLKRL